MFIQRLLNKEKNVWTMIEFNILAKDRPTLARPMMLCISLVLLCVFYMMLHIKLAMRRNLKLEAPAIFCATSTRMTLTESLDDRTRSVG